MGIEKFFKAWLGPSLYSVPRKHTSGRISEANRFYRLDENASKRLARELTLSKEHVEKLKGVVHDVEQVLAILNKLKLEGISEGAKTVYSEIRQAFEEILIEYDKIKHDDSYLHRISKLLKKLLSIEEKVAHLPDLEKLILDLRERNEHIEKELEQLMKDLRYLRNMINFVIKIIKRCITVQHFSFSEVLPTRDKERIEQRIAHTKEIIARLESVELSSEYKELVLLYQQIKRIKRLGLLDPNSDNSQVDVLRKEYTSKIIYKNAFELIKRKGIVHGYESFHSRPLDGRVSLGNLSIVFGLEYNTPGTSQNEFIEIYYGGRLVFEVDGRGFIHNGSYGPWLLEFDKDVKEFLGKTSRAA